MSPPSMAAIVMPQMGRRELVEALRELQPHMIILHMSGYADGAEDATELLPHGHAFHRDAIYS